MCGSFQHGVVGSRRWPRYAFDSEEREAWNSSYFTAPGKPWSNFTFFVVSDSQMKRNGPHTCLPSNSGENFLASVLLGSEVSQCMGKALPKILQGIFTIIWNIRASRKTSYVYCFMALLVKGLLAYCPHMHTPANVWIRSLFWLHRPGRWVAR